MVRAWQLSSAALQRSAQAARLSRSSSRSHLISGFELPQIWQERGCHLSTVAAEFVEDDRQTLECVTLAGFHVDPRGEWFELRELRFKRRKIRGIALDEQEIEFGGLQQLLAVRVAQQSLQREDW